LLRIEGRRKITAVQRQYVGLLAAPLTAKSQQAVKVYRIGYLGIGNAHGAATDSLLHALHDLGYTEGQNLVVEFRWAAGKAERLPHLAEELVRMPSGSSQGLAERLCVLARERGLPTLGTGLFFAEAGCLMGYGEDSLT